MLGVTTGSRAWHTLAQMRYATIALSSLIKEPALTMRLASFFYVHCIIKYRFNYTIYLNNFCIFLLYEKLYFIAYIYLCVQIKVISSSMPKFVVQLVAIINYFIIII